jgi:hypothetical protein
MEDLKTRFAHTLAWGQANFQGEGLVRRCDPEEDKDKRREPSIEKAEEAGRQAEDLGLSSSSSEKAQYQGPRPRLGCVSHLLACELA